jgi:hypothetical protein
MSYIPCQLFSWHCLFNTGSKIVPAGPEPRIVVPLCVVATAGPHHLLQETDSRPSRIYTLIVALFLQHFIIIGSRQQTLLDLHTHSLLHSSYNILHNWKQTTDPLGLTHSLLHSSYNILSWSRQQTFSDLYTYCCTLHTTFYHNWKQTAGSLGLTRSSQHVIFLLQI